MIYCKNCNNTLSSNRSNRGCFCSICDRKLEFEELLFEKPKSFWDGYEKRVIALANYESNLEYPYPLEPEEEHKEQILEELNNASSRIDNEEVLSEDEFEELFDEKIRDCIDDEVYNNINSEYHEYIDNCSLQDYFYNRFDWDDLINYTTLQLDDGMINYYLVE